MPSRDILVTRMRSRIRAAFFWGATLSSSVAFADPQAEARLAQALFDEGRALMAQKRWAEACPKLAESQRLDPGGGTLLNLALCHSGEGKTATALVGLDDALAAAVRDGRADREKLASLENQLLRAMPRRRVSTHRLHPSRERRAASQLRSSSQGRARARRHDLSGL